jgi:hypothetical protein
MENGGTTSIDCRHLHFEQESPMPELTQLPGMEKTGSWVFAEMRFTKN